MTTSIINAYHGTSKTNAKSIEKMKLFILSNDSRDWLGRGAYFFIDENIETAVNNATLWAINIKRYRDYGVMEAPIILDQDRVIDFNDQDWQDIFHEARLKLIEIIKKRSIEVIDDSYKLDSYVIDDLCKDNEIQAVVQQRFVNFYKYYGGNRLPVSHIPNCIIMCVKEAKIIKKDSIRIFKEGKKNG